MYKVVKEDFLEEVACEQRPERSEGASFRKSWDRDGGRWSKLPPAKTQKYERNG